MKKRILVEPLPAHGHFNAILSLAACLSNSYDFTFIGPSEFAGKVKDVGFDFKISEPFLFTPVKVRLQTVGIINFLAEHYFSRGHSVAEEIQRSEKRLDTLCEEIRPAMIWLDDHLAMKSFYYSKYKLPFVIIVTALPANSSDTVPPFQSMHTPKPTILSKILVRYYWQKHFFQRMISTLVWRGLTKGKTTRFIYENYVSHSNSIQVDLATSFNPIIKNIAYVTTTPRALEFPAANHANIFYFKPPVTKKVNEPLQSRLKSFIEKVQLRKQQDPSARLIYVSLGTIASHIKEKSHKFYQQIFKLALIEQSYHFIVSMGYSSDAPGMFGAHDNVIVLNSVPQQDLLPHVDAVINHGGINTVLECISAEIPMLAYPMSTEWDQPGVAARIQYHGLGLSDSFKNVGARSMKSNLAKLFSNYSYYKSRLQLKRKEIDRDSQENHVHLLQLIDDQFQ